MHTSCLFIFFAAQPGIGTGDPDGQLGCSVHRGCAVAGGGAVSGLSTVTVVAHQQHFKLLDVVDQEPPKATGQHGLGFLVAPLASTGLRVWPLSLLRTLLSMPPGLRQSRLSVTYWLDWCWMNSLVLSFRVSGFTRV